VPFRRKQTHRSNQPSEHHIDEEPQRDEPLRDRVNKVFLPASWTRRSIWGTVLLLSAAATAIISTISVSSRSPQQRVGRQDITDPAPVAVFGLEHAAKSTNTRTRTTAPSAQTPVPEPLSAKVPADLEATLRRCLPNIDAFCYAPVLESFQHQRRIPRIKVVEQRRRLLQLYPRVYKYAVSNLRLESLTAGRAVVSFDKEWNMVGEKHYAGSARERVVAVKTSGRWQILSQDEQQLHWTKRG
jgi:hypothetical protein